MEDSKLIYVLRLLSSKDLRDFKAYVASPLFNERETLRKLLDELILEFVKGKGKLTREEIYFKVYGGTEFKDGSLRTNLSQLFALLRDYLAFAEFRDDPVLRQRLLIRRSNSLDNDKFFSGFHRKGRKQLEKGSLNAADRFYEQMLLEEELDRFRLRRGQRKSRGTMQAAVELGGFSFLVRMLRYQLRALNRQESFQETNSSNFLAFTTDFIRRHLDELPLEIQAYYLFFRAFGAPGQPTFFQEARRHLTEVRAQLPPLDQEELYTNALNFGVHRLNNGEPDYLKVVFELYEEMLELNLLQQDGRLSPYHCKNIVGVALRLQEYDWATDFLGQWQDKIHPDHARNAFHYNQGMVCFYKADFEAAAKHFNRVLEDHVDIFYGLNTRGYLLQIYYETGDQLGLESLASSFRMFLQRKSELSVGRQRQYIAFINHLRRLANCGPHDQSRLAKLRQDIEDQKPAGMGKVWLLEKIGAVVGEGEEPERVGEED